MKLRICRRHQTKKGSVERNWNNQMTNRKSASQLPAQRALELYLAFYDLDCLNLLSHLLLLTSQKSSYTPIIFQYNQNRQQSPGIHSQHHAASLSPKLRFFIHNDATTMNHHTNKAPLNYFIGFPRSSGTSSYRHMI